MEYTVTAYFTAHATVTVSANDEETAFEKAEEKIVDMVGDQLDDITFTGGGEATVTGPSCDEDMYRDR